MRTPAAAAVDGWEPASFVLRCSAGHEWGSRGLYHRRSTWVDLRFPLCPRRDCGLPTATDAVYTGPGRPDVVEPDGVEPRRLGAIGTRADYLAMLGLKAPEAAESGRAVADPSAGVRTADSARRAARAYRGSGIA